MKQHKKNITEISVRDLPRLKKLIGKYVEIGFWDGIQHYNHDICLGQKVITLNGIMTEVNKKQCILGTYPIEISKILYLNENPE